MVPDRRTVQRWGRYADAITRWEHITGRPAPAPALLNNADGPRLCAAIVDRLTYNATIIETGTNSYRLAHTRARASVMG